MNLENYQASELPLYRPVVVSRSAVPTLRLRLARAILELAECAEIDVANSIFVTGAISNERLATLVASKPKAVARAIEQFKLRGLLETRRERFIIRQPERLRAIVAKAAG